jgi:hypothetical protein
VHFFNFVGVVEGSLRCFVSFCFGGLDHFGIHLLEFERLAVNGSLEILGCVADSFEFLNDCAWMVSASLPLEIVEQPGITSVRFFRKREILAISL